MTNLAVVGGAVLLICYASLLDFLRHRSRAAAIEVAGSILLLIMVLTHIAEQFHFISAMGWGRPDSEGHYLDLFSAIGGLGLLCTGFAVRLLKANR